MTKQSDKTTSSEPLVAAVTAESLAAELRSRGWSARPDTWNVGRWGEYPVCVIEANDGGDRVEMDVCFDRFGDASWFDYSEQDRRVSVSITPSALADLVIESVGDALVRAPD
ncbi:hypothetical protein P5V34_04950 [Mycobacteroides abscessus subsp. abscessus]|jgi:hypothetical protein|uniref:hypothetical protein n=1 Tax=Mycobacteroides abscessus TaxID=36809 RepID=UPI00266C88C3|nr:hypothetical protein [Mycobacteroides abscessus]MDO3013333.1 hypothetical protein [Mycobacteroides abscessus subsp. abscessus]